MDARWLSLSGGMIAESVSGSAYLLGVYSPQVKAILNLTQLDLQDISSIGNVGQYATIDAGIIFDLLGVRATIVIGVLLNALGYLLFWAGLKGSVPNSAGMMSLYAFLWNHGSSCIDVSSLSSSIRNFPKNKGLVIGMVKSFFGLSASILTVLYTIFYKPDVISFLEFIAILIPSISLLGGIFQSVVPQADAMKPISPIGLRKLFVGYVGVISLATFAVTVTSLIGRGNITASAAFGYILPVFVGVQLVHALPEAWFPCACGLRKKMP